MRLGFKNIHDLIGQHADLILRPSIPSAACTLDMTTLLDHEFVFKDVLFEKQN